MITPEPSDCSTRSRGMFCMPKNWRKNGSLMNGLLTRTCVFELMLTTAGTTRSSIGASEGSAWPSTATGSAARLTEMPHSPASARVNRDKSDLDQRERWRSECEKWRMDSFIGLQLSVIAKRVE